MNVFILLEVNATVSGRGLEREDMVPMVIDHGVDCAIYDLHGAKRKGGGKP